MSNVFCFVGQFCYFYYIFYFVPTSTSDQICCSKVPIDCRYLILFLNWFKEILICSKPYSVVSYPYHSGLSNLDFCKYWILHIAVWIEFVALCTFYVTIFNHCLWISIACLTSLLDLGLCETLYKDHLRIGFTHPTNLGMVNYFPKQDFFWLV